MFDCKFVHGDLVRVMKGPFRHKVGEVTEAHKFIFWWDYLVIFHSPACLLINDDNLRESPDPKAIPTSQLELYKFDSRMEGEV